MWNLDPRLFFCLFVNQRIKFEFVGMESIKFMNDCNNDNRYIKNGYMIKISLLLFNKSVYLIRNCDRLKNDYNIKTFSNVWTIFLFKESWINYLVHYLYFHFSLSKYLKDCSICIDDQQLIRFFFIIYHFTRR